MVKRVGFLVAHAGLAPEQFVFIDQLQQEVHNQPSGPEGNADQPLFPVQAVVRPVFVAHEHHSSETHQDDLGGHDYKYYY